MGRRVTGVLIGRAMTASSARATRVPDWDVGLMSKRAGYYAKGVSRAVKRLRVRYTVGLETAKSSARSLME